MRVMCIVDDTGRLWRAPEVKFATKANFTVAVVVPSLPVSSVKNPLQAVMMTQKNRTSKNTRFRNMMPPVSSTRFYSSSGAE